MPFTTPTSPLPGGLPQRARDLSLAVERILADSKADKVHIIGHSMGELNGRFLLCPHRNNLSSRVRSLTTVGMPHPGTSFADWGLISDNVGQAAIVLQRQNGITRPVLQYAFPIPAGHLNQFGGWDLDELAGLHWWNWRPLWRKWRFETAVKQFHAHLAHTL
ncbi:MAG: hypothetical protein R3C62_14565 [Chloroflexota bacterium]